VTNRGLVAQRKTLNAATLSNKDGITPFQRLMTQIVDQTRALDHSDTRGMAAKLVAAVAPKSQSNAAAACPGSRIAAQHRCL
jgi:hypothetical protein